MRAELRVTRNGEVLYQNTHEISDAQSFGEACSQVWDAIEEGRIKAATSIGALYDDLENDAGALDGIVISLRRVIS